MDASRHGARRPALLEELVHAYETNRQLLHKRVAKAERRAAEAEAELAELQRSVFGAVRARPRSAPLPQPPQRAPLETITNGAVLPGAPSGPAAPRSIDKRRPQIISPTRVSDGPDGGTGGLPELALPPRTPRVDPMTSPVSLLNPRLLLKVFGYLQPFVLTSQVALVCKCWQRVVNEPALWDSQAEHVRHWSTSLPGTPARTPATAPRVRLGLADPALQRAKEELERAGSRRLAVTSLASESADDSALQDSVEYLYSYR